MKLFLDTQKKDSEIVYTKKDPLQHIHKIEYEDLSDTKPYNHIEDSAQYIHDLRRERENELVKKFDRFNKLKHSTVETKRELNLGFVKVSPIVKTKKHQDEK